MSNTLTYCPRVLCTNRKKFWNYDERYMGEKDAEQRKSGQGENHWTGAESIEQYRGYFFRDTMHGAGEYKWHHTGSEGHHLTYEGYFFANNMHGYGTMSYPDGKTFRGLFHTNVRWGPGVQSHACLEEDVGLWCGTQLVRLAWRPEGPSVAPVFNMTIAGRSLVEAMRIKMRARFEKSPRQIEERNRAKDILKHHESLPEGAIELWEPLYAKHCIDPTSLVCRIEEFERDYYNGSIPVLEEIPIFPKFETSHLHNEKHSEFTTYYSWNNNKNMIHMMKHSYTHDCQRNNVGINLTQVLSGPRNNFKPAGQHETDCRTLLMASFLGDVAKVVTLINEHGVRPDVTDGLGNSAIMYAACGDRPNIIHFLSEAGANVNSYNDSCCTPLAIALLRLTCVLKNVSPNEMTNATFPATVTISPTSSEIKNSEWNMEKSQVTNFSNGLTRTPSRILKNSFSKRLKSSQTLKDIDHNKKNIGLDTAYKETNWNHSNIYNKNDYYNITNEFIIQINDNYLNTTEAKSLQYIFDVRDMVKDAIELEDDPKKSQDKIPKKTLSKVIKESAKTSKDVIWQNIEKEDTSIVNRDKEKVKDSVESIMHTIMQLLADGAKPKFVKCPKPALFIAITSGNNELVKHLVEFGADINEEYCETFGYTPLDLAVSLPFSNTNLDTIRTILECGAKPNRRLNCNKVFSDDPMMDQYVGPTLLHAVLARKIENAVDEEIQCSLLQLLLEYNFDPIAQYNGCSAIDLAMTKNFCLLDVFIKSRVTNLNSVINRNNQTILVKMFSVEFFKSVPSAQRLQTVTNLLRFGADPLVRCANENEKFANLFVYAQKTLAELESAYIKPTPAFASKKPESKKGEKSKKDQIPAKSSGKPIADDIDEYKKTIDFVLECARVSHVRWLQAKLAKELIGVINKYKHMQWNMIIKEHDMKNSTRLWLTPSRCLEIWDILTTTKRKIFDDGRVLKHLLCIVMYYNSKTDILESAKITAEEKHSIDSCVMHLLKERKNFKNQNYNISLKDCNVNPELTAKTEKRKFHICFECALPLNEDKIQCSFCKIISFCNLECIKINIDRADCHPCSDMLKNKYF